MSENDPLRRISLKIALGLIFLRFGMFHFFLFKLTRVNFHLIPLFGLPVVLGVALSGGFARSFRGRAVAYWCAYAIWLIATIPSSNWPGGSFKTVFGFILVELPMMFVLGGLALTWRECRSILHAIAWGAVASALAGLFMRREYEGFRMTLELGTMANANDYAAHLLLVLPFLLWAGLQSRLLLRIPALGVFALGCYMIVMTASRGAAVALAACLLFLLVRSPGRWRITLIAGVPVGALVLLSVVPGAVWNRITALSAGSSSADAVGSMLLRQRTLQRSISNTIHHPLFGVGPAQFVNVEGQAEGLWLVPHNTYAEISGECGVPALIAYLAGMVSAFLLLNSTYGLCRRRDDCKDIRNALLCVMLGMVGFAVASTFLSLAYTFYMPAMGGFAVAFSFAARREMKEREACAADGGAAAAKAPWAPVTPPTRIIFTAPRQRP